MTLAGIATAVVLAILGVMAWALRRSGKTEAQRDHANDAIDVVKKANEARDSLADPGVTDELRSRYRR